MVTPAAKRKAVAHLRMTFGMSERRACRVLGSCRMTVRYQTRRSDDGAWRQRMKSIAYERHRFSDRRLHVLLRREGYVVNHKRLFRLYREERLAVRRRSGRKRALGTRAPMMVPLYPNERWSLDFVSDQLTDGRRFRMLAIVDDCTRECLALVADTSLSGRRVARELDELIRVRGKPTMVVSDNGTELPPILSYNGPTIVASPGTISRRASRRRMPSSRASLANSVTKCSTKRCSTRFWMHALSFRLGKSITTPIDHTLNSAGMRRPSTPGNTSHVTCSI